MNQAVGTDPGSPGCTLPVNGPGLTAQWQQHLEPGEAHLTAVYGKESDVIDPGPSSFGCSLTRINGALTTRLSR